MNKEVMNLNSNSRIFYLPSELSNRSKLLCR